MFVRRLRQQDNIGQPIRFTVEVSDFSYHKLAKAMKLDDYDREAREEPASTAEENLRRHLAFAIRDRMLAIFKKLGEYTVRGI